jgi:hypothetical protein
MANDQAPPDNFIAYGIQLDEARVRFKIIRNDVTKGEISEFDEDTDAWKVPPT